MASPTRVEGTGPVRRGTDRFDEWPDTEPGAALTGPFDLGDHLDLEDEALISWGLAQSVSAEGPKAKIDVLYGVGNELSWESDVNDEDVRRQKQTGKVMLPSWARDIKSKT